MSAVLLFVNRKKAVVMDLHLENRKQHTHVFLEKVISDQDIFLFFKNF